MKLSKKRKVVVIAAIIAGINVLAFGFMLIKPHLSNTVTAAKGLAAVAELRQSCDGHGSGSGNGHKTPRLRIVPERPKGLQSGAVAYSAARSATPATS